MRSVRTRQRKHSQKAAALYLQRGDQRLQHHRILHATDAVSVSDMSLRARARKSADLEHGRE
eukprot:2189446-Rhodomonas_salina.1